MFRLDKAKVVFVTKKKDIKEAIVRPIKKEYQFVITRSLGVGNKLVFTVYDRQVMRYVFYAQGDIRNGVKLTRKVKSIYRNHMFNDKLTKEDETLFEF